jgi:hypothetical protein
MCLSVRPIGAKGAEGLRMPIELWLLAGVLPLLAGLPLVIVRLDMAKGYLEATEQVLAATWLGGTLYRATTTLKLEIQIQAACENPTVI